MIPHLRLQQKSSPGCVAGDWTLHGTDGAVEATFHRFKGFLLTTRQMLGKWNSDGRGMNILRDSRGPEWRDWLLPRAGDKNPPKQGTEALVFLPHYKRLVIMGSFSPYNAQALQLAAQGTLYGFRGDFRFTQPRPSYTVAMEKLDLPVNLGAMPAGWARIRGDFERGEIV
jgi:hypothetical protein